MNLFKQMMQNDINLLFDVTMFAEIHNINGAQMPVIIDNDKLADLKVKSRYAEDISAAEMLIIVKISDFGLRPAIGQIIHFDDDIYRVVAVTNSDGLFEITMEANG